MKQTKPLTVAKVPCGSCPYRCDVPSGIWALSEYAKLPHYDRPLIEQPWQVFMCHQHDGKLCAGWVACHGDNLLALRFATERFDPAVFSYASPVPVFATGAAAREHGVRDYLNPGVPARTITAGLRKLQRKRRKQTTQPKRRRR